MSIGRSAKRSFGSAALIVALVGGFAVATAAAAQAAPVSFVSPSMGLTSSDTARLSVVNSGTVPQTETLSILDIRSRILVTQTIQIPPGGSAFVDATSTRPRIEVHGAIGPVNIPADLQTFDSITLQTTAIVQGFQVAPPSGMGVFTSPSIGVTSAQTGRLSVVNDGTAAQNETLSIVNARGVTLRTKALTIAAGRTAWIDLAKRSPRLEIHGTISPTNLPADLEVFDSTSLETSALAENFQTSPAVGAEFYLPATMVVPGETGRLSVVNDGTAAQTETLSILSDQGVVLASRTILVDPGHSAFVQTGPTRSVIEVHPEVSPAGLAADLQVFGNDTLRTSVLEEDFQAEPPGQGSLTSSSVGLTPGEFARLNVVNDGSSAVTETLSILDEAGTVLGTMSVPIDPDHSVSLDVETRLPRSEVHAVIGPVAFLPSLEVCDSITLETSALVDNFLPTAP